MPLPINIQDLLAGKTVENERIEFKAGWNPSAIYRTICAFANDFSDIGGGYIVVGVEEKDGVPVRPVRGLAQETLDKIQREMIGYNNLVLPVYHPRISIETVDGKFILVIWILAGPNRPYEVPEDIKAKEKKYFYYIRKYSNSVKANRDERQELISLSNKIPFDDRPNIHASLDDISYTLVKEHLRQTGSRLLEQVDSLSKAEVLDLMGLLDGPPEMLHPKNVALMMFSDKPEKYFPYSRVELVYFPKGEEDPEFIEYPSISGPVPDMIRSTMNFFRTTILKEKVIKVPGQSESLRIWNYPEAALEEAVANSLYHREYQTREPVEVRIYPDSLVIINYGGPDRSLKIESFKKGIIRPRRYRNRRLGDFLKELDLTEGKATGIPTIRKAIKRNGSPNPEFETDEDRSYFMILFHTHEQFKTESKQSGGTKVVQSGGTKVVQSDDTTALTDRQEQIVKLLRENPNLSVRKLASILGLNSSAVQKHLNTLKEKKLIQRIGGTRGYWKIKN